MPQKACCISLINIVPFKAPLKEIILFTMHHSKVFVGNVAPALAANLPFIRNSLQYRTFVISHASIDLPRLLFRNLTCRKDILLNELLRITLFLLRTVKATFQGSLLTCFATYDCISKWPS